MSFLDLDEFLIDLAPQIDLVYSPVIDVKTYPDDVDLCLVEGAVCNSDHLELLRSIRARTTCLVSFGDCAVTANVPAMRNQFGPHNAESVLQRAYIDTAQDLPQLPSEPGIVPTLLERVMPLHEAVYVDFFVPGCPPPADRIRAVLALVLAGNLPSLLPDQLKFG